jgi:H+/Cl- antiporter ClcA
MPNHSYRRVIAHAVLLGLFGGAFGLVYLLLVETGTHAIWPNTETFDWFSGGWRSFLIPVAAGLVIGILYRVLKLPARFKGFIAELEEGHVEPKTTPGALLIAIVSLIGGASLGPEAPLATAAGGAGTWLARRTGGNDLDTRVATFSGISGVFGGLMSTPIGGPLIAFELEHQQTNSYYYQQIVPGAIAGALGFAVMWPVIGTPMVGLYEFDAVEFRDWMLLAGAGIGIVAGLAALIVGRIMVGVVSLMRRFDPRPIVRGLIGGVAIGLIGFAMPLTLLSGVTGLDPVFEQPQVIGVGLLLALSLLKAVALGASLGGGFFGGSIFPIFFIGGTLGAAIHLLIPEIPLGLAAGCAMAAMAAAIAMVPISMALIGTFLVQGGLLVSGAILVAVVTAYAVRFALAPPGQESDASKAGAAGPAAAPAGSAEAPA